MKGPAGRKTLEVLHNEFIGAQIMNRRRSRLGGVVIATLPVVLLSAPAPGQQDGFTLAGAIPNDVFAYLAERHNPEREFVRQYWGEVVDALKQCGIRQDALELIGSLLGEEQKAELARLEERAEQVLAGVDWEHLASKETA
ncbi:MAG: hypothetical protein ACE5K7_04000, partial [Phycisphaerae bacterium]